MGHVRPPTCRLQPPHAGHGPQPLLVKPATGGSDAPLDPFVLVVAIPSNSYPSRSAASRVLRSDRAVSTSRAHATTLNFCDAVVASSDPRACRSGWYCRDRRRKDLRMSTSLASGSTPSARQAATTSRIVGSRRMSGWWDVWGVGRRNAKARDGETARAVGTNLLGGLVGVGRGEEWRGCLFGPSLYSYMVYAADTRGGTLLVRQEKQPWRQSARQTSEG